MLKTAMRSVAAAAMLLAGGIAAEAKNVTFTTDFGFNGRHAFFYVALDKGYYAEEGLDVEILRGQGSADAIRKVAAGTAQIGFADAGALVLARGNDGLPVKLVSIVYASSPHAIYAIEGSGIDSAADLEGRKVADTAFSAIPLLFPAYAKAAGIDPEAVEWITAEGAALPSLLAQGRVDAVGQFTVGAPLLAKAVAPKALVELGYADAGLDYYGNGLIATEETIGSDPELVKAFVRATYRGLADAIADPQEAGEIIHKYQKQIDPEIGAAETEKVGALVAEGAAPGRIDPDMIAGTIAVVEGAYELKAPVAPQDLYAPGFAE
ncbi:ABC transporter substrate-binding protein [Poseidonocella sp. HB161398]|uniref:ABC transporter substrate-binding protein n=1 Tax=Poseidonocella sp. HB161398 TaxID=2320855 RepID=UPI0019815E30|nr:ABC transporter substrate-binding protein [Poseidonocella sp. HB161398]